MLLVTQRRVDLPRMGPADDVVALPCGAPIPVILGRPP